jgi:hypothetical protein
VFLLMRVSYSVLFVAHWLIKRNKQNVIHQRLRRRLRNLHFFPKAANKTTTTMKPVNAIWIIVLAAFMISPENNPKRPDNVATSMKPAIHLAAFAEECPAIPAQPSKYRLL